MPFWITEDSYFFIKSTNCLPHTSSFSNHRGVLSPSAIVFASFYLLAEMKVILGLSEGVRNSCDVSKLVFCFFPFLISCITEHVRSWPLCTG